MKERKNYLHQYAQQYVTDKLVALRRQILALKEDMNTESKSTAGDKHETGRAMMQIELENLGRALKEAELLQETLRKIQNPERLSPRISLGSLIGCQGNWYYLSISAGMTTYQSQKYYFVSVQSPLGSQLIGKTIGETVTLPKGVCQITEVY